MYKYILVHICTIAPSLPNPGNQNPNGYNHYKSVYSHDRFLMIRGVIAYGFAMVKCAHMTKPWSRVRMTKPWSRMHMTKPWLHLIYGGNE